VRHVVFAGSFRTSVTVVVAGRIDAGRLVFVAECGAHTSLAPLYGWSREGERAHFKVPRNRGANITLLASMSLRACLVKVRVNLFVGLGYAEGPNCDGFLW
jgi:hypothetical protein